jgi:hypothetical protein
MKFRSGKRRKIFLITLGSILGVIIVVFSLLMIFLEDIVSSRLNELLKEKFGTYYAMEFESIEKDVNLVNVSLTIKKVEFKTDTTDQEGIKKYPVIFFKTEELRVSNISTWDILLGRELNLEEILLDHPFFAFYERDLNKQESVTGEVYSASFLNQINIDRIRMIGGKLAYYDFETRKKLLYNDSINFDFEGVRLDLNNIVDYQEAFQFEDFSLEAYKMKYIPLEGIYDFYMDSLRVSFKNHSVELKEFKVLTKESILKASMSTTNQTEVVNFDLEQVLVSGIDFKRLYLQNELYVKKVNAKNIIVDVFKNKLKGYEKGFTKNVLNHDLRNIPFPIKVDSVLFSNANIFFEIWNQKEVKPAKMKIQKLDGKVANFTTFKEENDTMRVEVDGVLMNQGKLNWNMVVAIQDSLSNYQKFWGNVRNLPFASVSPVIENFINLKVTSGMLVRLDFTGRSDTWSSYGKVAFRYRDMGFKIYSLNDFKKKNVNGFLTGMAKTVIYPNNPLPNGDFRLADFRYKRLPHESSIMHWVGGILIGSVKTCVKDFVLPIVEDMTQKKIDKVLDENGLPPTKEKIKIKDKKKKKKKNRTNK